jgi:hypothetical protein
MTQHDERLPALGQPVEQPEPEGDHDFAGEHDITTVDRQVAEGRGGATEEESPQGWSGLEGA